MLDHKIRPSGNLQGMSHRSVPSISDDKITEQAQQDPWYILTPS
jgi:hypothetical protein